MPRGADLSAGGQSLLRGFGPSWWVQLWLCSEQGFCLHACPAGATGANSAAPGHVRRDLLHDSPTGENQTFRGWVRKRCLQRKIKKLNLTANEAFLHPILTRKTVFPLCSQHRKSPNSSIPFKLVNWSLQSPNRAADHDVAHGSAVPGQTEPLLCAGVALSSASWFQGLGLCWFPVLMPP